ncbi:MAG TPA: competence/damage-inducible protein A [Verrucomicrobiae bacterium]|nr:competence/damage-inducible protein A [Verrucomicrobiae bacterium]
MRVELITTGSELMLGFTINTHLSYIARQLARIGLRLDRQVTVADDRAEMRTAIAEALPRCDVLLITGGLGPTSDDFTRDVVAELLGRKLVRDEAVAAAIAERVRKRKLRLPESIYVQALVPVGAQALPNRSGTAPGLAIDHEGKLVLLLPGPPRELKPMFEEYVLPVLEKHFAAQFRFDCRVFKVVGLPESTVEERIAPALADLEGLELGYSAKLGEVEVRIISRLKSEITAAESRIRSALGEDIYGTEDDRLEEVVVKMLTAAHQTIAVAESCTGGLIANRITNVSGSSEVFINGCVTYSNESKTRLLGVREETLKAHGAVSEEVAREMAEGVRARAGTHFGISTTGIAGPTGGTPGKPVGLVYIGLATPTRTEVKRHLLLFDRETFKFFTSQNALDMVRRELLQLDNGAVGHRALPSNQLSNQSVASSVGRAGPSAPLPQRRILNHDIPSWLRPEDAVFFLTVCCQPRKHNQLCKPEIAPAVFESIDVRQRSSDWWMHLALLMPDHLHALVSFPQDKEMRKVITEWKKYLARKLGIRWQRDFFDHRIRNEESVQEKADYILQNPVRAGLVARAEDWSYVWTPDKRRGAVGAPRPTTDSERESLP